MMLLGFILLLFLNNSTVKSQILNSSSTTNSPPGTSSPLVNTQTLPPLQLVANPDYPVTAGQRVILQCKALIMTENITLFWQWMHNHTWKDVATGTELCLTEPEQSGEYRCVDKRQALQLRPSQSHTVYIISTRATVGENLGIAAFVLNLVLIITIIGIILWLGYQGFHHTIKTSSTADKGFPGSEIPSNKGIPQTNSDQNVYMNYTSNQAYTDLDPSNMTGDPVYSSLS